LHDNASRTYPERKRPGFTLLPAQFRKVRSQLLASKEHEMSPAVREMAEFVNANDFALRAHWKMGPQALIHGDCHLGNTFRLPDGSIGLLDFQVVHRAPGLPDAAYFLTHSLPTDVRRAHAEEYRYRVSVPVGASRNAVCGGTR
jgi:Ser/Thr protein kinase RdoA (MazF antagonist)